MNKKKPTPTFKFGLIYSSLLVLLTVRVFKVHLAYCQSCVFQCVCQWQGTALCQLCQGRRHLLRLLQLQTGAAINPIKQLNPLQASTGLQWIYKLFSTLSTLPTTQALIKLLQLQQQLILNANHIQFLPFTLQHSTLK